MLGFFLYVFFGISSGNFPDSFFFWKIGGKRLKSNFVKIFHGHFQ